MLGKLMKYEIKATARILIPLYVALLAFAIINKIFIGTGLADRLEGFGSIPFVISIFAYGCTMAAVFIVTFFVIVQRFYKNLLGDEGYLMNTLPVSTTINIASKLSIATVWNIASGIVALLSIIIMAFNTTDFMSFFNDVFRALSEGYNELGIQLFVIILEVIIIILIALARLLSMIYASISIGHLFSKHKILSSFGAFIVLNIIFNTITSIIVIVFALIGRNIDPNSFLQSISPVICLHGALLSVILYNLIFFIIFFIITNYILKNKLNLE